MRSVALLTAVATVGGCGLQRVDPCAGVAGTCVAVQVEAEGEGSLRVDQLELHAVGDQLDAHASAGDGRPHDLPIAVALIVDPLPASPLSLTVDVVGTLGGSIRGAGHAQAQVFVGQHTSARVGLAPVGSNGEDLGSSEDLAADDLPATDLAEPTDAAGPCTLGATRCSGNVEQKCTATGWVDQTTCTAFCRDPGCVVPSSCVGLSASCGPARTDGCCQSPSVPMVTFKRSYDGVTTGYTDPSFTATVSAFRLDRFEVTVGRFRKFVAGGTATQANPPAAGSGAHPAIANSGWQATWNSSLAADTTSLGSALNCDATYASWTANAGTPDQEARPINCVTWYEAFAFCAWDGGRLPTEAEWNAASAGGGDQRVFPFGASIDATYASYDCTGDGSAAGMCGAGDILVVGSRAPKGDGKFGQSDLAGNLSELTLDWYNTYVTPCVDCAQLTQGPTMKRAARGGSFASASSSLLSSVRLQGTPSVRDGTIGFRCARAP